MPSHSKTASAPQVAPEALPETVATPVGDLELHTLRQWRDIRKLSQAELARRLGMNQSTIYTLEVGKNVASIDTALRIAAALGVMVEQVAWHARPQAKKGSKP